MFKIGILQGSKQFLTEPYTKSNFQYLKKIYKMFKIGILQEDKTFFIEPYIKSTVRKKNVAGDAVKSNFQHFRRGSIAIITVLIFTAFIMLIATTIGSITKNRMQTLPIKETSSENEIFNYGCMEEGLYRLKKDINYVGGILNLSDKNCTIEVSDDNGKKIIISTAEKENITKKIKVKAQITVSGSANNIEILSWEEI